MAFNRTISFTADGKITFTVAGEGKSQRYFLLDAQNKDKIDHVTNLTVESSVNEYLDNNLEAAISNPRETQVTIERIEQRAIMGFDAAAGEEIADQEADISLVGLQGTYNRTPRSSEGGLLEAAASAAGTPGSTTFTNPDGSNPNSIITFDDVAGKSLQQNSVGKMNSTIGGADLSVFYMAEVPVMEDVLDPTATPDTWRSEIITIELDSVLSLSYSTLREKFPVRQLGKANPAAYTYGPRSIAGHLAFAIFTEDVLMRIRGRVRNEFLRAGEKYKGALQDRLETLSTYYTAALELNTAQLLDSLIPFHLLVMGMNERGAFSKFIIKNVYIVDENQYQGTRHPNILNKVSYVAEDIVPMSYVNGSQALTESMSPTAEGLELGAVTLDGKWPDLSGSALVKTIKEKDLTIIRG